MWLAVRLPVVLRIMQIQRPVLGNALLGFPKSYFSCFDLRREIILDVVLYLEIPLIQWNAVRATLGPDIIETVRASQFKRDKVIFLARLILTRVVRGLINSVPVVRRILGTVSSVFVANTFCGE